MKKYETGEKEEQKHKKERKRQESSLFNCLKYHVLI